MVKADSGSQRAYGETWEFCGREHLRLAGRVCLLWPQPHEAQGRCEAIAAQQATDESGLQKWFGRKLGPLLCCFACVLFRSGLGHAYAQRSLLRFLVRGLLGHPERVGPEVAAVQMWRISTWMKATPGKKFQGRCHG